MASGVDEELATVVEALAMGKNRYVQAFLALDLADPNAYIDAHVPDQRSKDIVYGSWPRANGSLKWLGITTSALTEFTKF